MYVKKVKRKCGVRGCKCTDSYAISLTREVGNSVIICKSCLGKALGALDEIPEEEPKVATKGIPSLFFNAKALGVTEKEDIIETEAEQKEETDETPDTVTDEESEAEATTLPDAETEAEQETVEEEETDEKTDTLTEEAENEAASLHVCPICNKVFDTERGLKAHMRTHKGAE